MLRRGRHHAKGVPGSILFSPIRSRARSGSNTRRPATITGRRSTAAAARQKITKRHAIKACLVIWAHVFSAGREEPRVHSKPAGIPYCAVTALFIPAPFPALHRFSEFLLFLSAFHGFVKPAPYFSISRSEIKSICPGTLLLMLKKRANR